MNISLGGEGRTSVNNSLFVFFSFSSLNINIIISTIMNSSTAESAGRKAGA